MYDDGAETPILLHRRLHCKHWLYIHHPNVTILAFHPTQSSGGNARMMRMQVYVCIPKADIHQEVYTISTLSVGAPIMIVYCQGTLVPELLPLFLVSLGPNFAEHSKSFWCHYLSLVMVGLGPLRPAMECNWKLSGLVTRFV